MLYLFQRVGSRDNRGKKRPDEKQANNQRTGYFRFLVSFRMKSACAEGKTAQYSTHTWSFRRKNRHFTITGKEHTNRNIGISLLVHNFRVFFSSSFPFNAKNNENERKNGNSMWSRGCDHFLLLFQPTNPTTKNWWERNSQSQRVKKIVWICENIIKCGSFNHASALIYIYGIHSLFYGAESKFLLNHFHWYFQSLFPFKLFLSLSFSFCRCFLIPGCHCIAHQTK